MLLGVSNTVNPYVMMFLVYDKSEGEFLSVKNRRHIQGN